jgi:hypothetical protein
MTINEIIENENIRSDRYAMAAISYIFKAFGDSNRSREYWPWGRDVQCEWTPSKGTSNDITQAELLLKRAKNKFYEENGEYRSLSNKYVSMFKIENVEFIETIALIPTYKIKVNALHYYERDNASKIYKLKEGDYLCLTFDNDYTIFKINEVDIKTNELVIDRVFGEYDLNSDSVYRNDPRMYLQIYVTESNTKISGGSMNDFDKQMKELKRRINKVAINMKRINKSSQEVRSVSDRANDIVDSVIPKKNE